VVVGGLLPLCGCNNQYSANLRYGLRTELLVTDVPKTDPPRLDPPGDLNDWLSRLPAQDAKTADPATLDGKDRQALDKALEDMFGTPLHPRVKAEGLDQDVVKKLRLEEATLAEGSELFRIHCLHCHGVTGNGRGPTAPWVNPHPRDYRQGIFKFTSSSQSSGTRKPRREDLVRTITQGLEGTSMPAFGAQSNSKFGVLAEEQIQKLASYVIHLSLRGQVEFETMLPRLGKDKTELLVDDQPATVADYAADRLKTLAGYWVQAETKAIEPGKYAEPKNQAELTASIARGYKQFLDPGAAGCIKCHTDFGRRNNYKWDSWGTVVRPRDLTEGIFRGGRRPIDVYWRIHGGINGAAMPDASGSLKPEQIWDLVNFVEALPYPAMLPEDIRDQIYPDQAKEHAGRAAFAPASRPVAQE
jgi:mono/diheme cytochrome c family protein